MGKLRTSKKSRTRKRLPKKLRARKNTRKSQSRAARLPIKRPSSQARLVKSKSYVVTRGEGTFKSRQKKFKLNRPKKFGIRDSKRLLSSQLKGLHYKKSELVTVQWLLKVGKKSFHTITITQEPGEIQNYFLDEVNRQIREYKKRFKLINYAITITEKNKARRMVSRSKNRKAKKPKNKARRMVSRSKNRKAKKPKNSRFRR